MMVMWSRADGVGDSGVAAAKGVIRYMTAHQFTKSVDGDRVVELRNPPPEILRGDPGIMAAAIAAVPFERRYVSCVLSFHTGDIDMDRWNAGDHELRQQIEDLITSFEESMFAGIDTADRPPTYWTTHRHVGRLELNFVSPRAVLVGDQLRSININPPGQEQRRLCDAWRDVENSRHAWADPEDPSRRQTVKVPDHIQKIDALRQRLGEASKADIREVLTEAISEQIAAGTISNREGVLEYLGLCEADITRVGADYISVKFPGDERATRLKGEIYSVSFTGPEALSAQQLGRAIDLGDAERRLAEATARRGEFNFNRYQAKIDQARGFDRANPWPEGYKFTVTDGPMTPAARTHGPGSIETNEAEKERRRQYGKQRAWQSLYGSTLPPELLAGVRRIKPGAPSTIYLSDGGRVVDHGNRLTAEPDASDLAIQIMLAETRARGWNSVKITGNHQFKVAAAIAMSEAGLAVENPELAKLVNSIRRAKSEAERAAEALPDIPTTKQEPSMDSDTSLDLAPPQAKPRATNFIRAVEQGPRPLPAQPIDFDSNDMRQLYLRQNFGQAWPEDKVANVRFVRRMRDEGGVDITMQTGQVIADRPDGTISLSKGEISESTADTIVFAAAQRGWKAIEIDEGADAEFRRQIIESAARQGMEVSGLDADSQQVFEAARRQIEEAEAERRRQSGAVVAAQLAEALGAPIHRPAATVSPNAPESIAPDVDRSRTPEPGM